MKLKKGGFSGEMSLFNSLTLCQRILYNTPSYGTKEIIVIYSSLSSCDPGNVVELIDTLRKQVL